MSEDKILDNWNEIIELIQTTPNIEVNKYGYKLMGWFDDNHNNCIIFDGKKNIQMTYEQFVNFSRERKLSFILNGR